ncbi:hypothetical protein DRJ17_03415 [Candidatus Woesearchaeota archaeon]|nr:MAG: hypothetical protein DRJ17_03415 [Candidatus Woesearchaeota archaeon]
MPLLTKKDLTKIGKSLGIHPSTIEYCRNNPKSVEAARREFKRAGYLKKIDDKKPLRTGFRQAIYNAALKFSRTGKSEYLTDLKKEYSRNPAFTTYLDMAFSLASKVSLGGIKNIPHNGTSKTNLQNTEDYLASMLTYLAITDQKESLNGELGELQRSMLIINDHVNFSSNAVKGGERLEDRLPNDFKRAIASMRAVAKNGSIRKPTLYNKVLWN